MKNSDRWPDFPSEAMARVVQPAKRRGGLACTVHSLTRAWGQGVYRLFLFSIRRHTGQTPKRGESLASTKFSVGQYLHMLEECQTDLLLSLRYVRFGPAPDVSKQSNNLEAI